MATAPAEAKTAAQLAAEKKALMRAKAPPWVKARERGYYEQLREPGDVFENTDRLPAYPKDPENPEEWEDVNSWLETAKAPTEAAVE